MIGVSLSAKTTLHVEQVMHKKHPLLRAVTGPFGLIFSADLALTAQVLVFFTSCSCFIENKVRNSLRLYIFSLRLRLGIG